MKFALNNMIVGPTTQLAHLRIPPPHTWSWPTGLVAQFCLRIRWYLAQPGSSGVVIMIDKNITRGPLGVTGPPYKSPISIALSHRRKVVYWMTEWDHVAAAAWVHGRRRAGGTTQSSGVTASRLMRAAPSPRRLDPFIRCSSSRFLLIFLFNFLLIDHRQCGSDRFLTIIL